MAWMHYDLRDSAPGVAYTLLTGVVVPRPIAWVTTRAPDGTVNAAPFSYFGLLGSEPPIVAFGPGDRPDGEPKDTARNISPGGHFVVNLVPFALVDRMNLTATDFPPGTSEPEVAGLALEDGRHGPVPRLADSPVGLECVEHSTLTIGRNRVVIGEVWGVTVRADLLLDPARGLVNTPALELVGRMGGRGGYARAQDTFERPRIRYADWLNEQGVSIRPATPEDAAAITRVHIQSWRETYAGLLPPAYLARMTNEETRARREAKRVRSVANPAVVTLVAELGGEVVGFVTGGAARGESAYGAELYALYSLRAAQGKGLGRALVRELARSLQARGHQDLMLWVLAENPTRGFYAHLGGQALTEKRVPVPEGELHEVAYGWPDLRTLL